MPHRPLVFVCAATLGDYLLWNWSLGANHAVLALLSGLTLPPLALACLWLLALAVGRVLTQVNRRGPPAGRARSQRERPAQEGEADVAPRRRAGADGEVLPAEEGLPVQPQPAHAGRPPDRVAA